jgi:hypothetical protein
MLEIPRFASEDEERAFWTTHDSMDFLEGAEQVKLDYVGREHEFIFVPPVESQPFHTSSIYVTSRSEWVITAPSQEQRPEWKYVDIELGMAS